MTDAIPLHSAPRGQSPQSVTRVIRILEGLCARPGPASLAELAREFGTPKSSLAALLRGLSDEGFVVPVDGGWRLGPGAFGLGSALLEARRRLQSSDLIRDGMRRLAVQSGETVLLGVRDPGGETLTYVDLVESRNPVRFAVSIGDRRPLYATAGGRMLLAALPEADLRTYLDGVRPMRLTPATETSKAKLLAAVAQARADGVAQTVDQAGEGVTGTAAPILDAAAEAVGALIVAAPSGRWHERRVDLARMVRAEAELLSRSLGYRGKRPG
ncbi:MAG: IclR family transcriptional regulator [Novosphingobium sp.]